VKPQVEAGPEDVGRGAVVRDPGVWRRSIAEVASACERAGAGPRAVMASPLAGPAGNVEFLLHARKGQAGRPIDVDGALEEGMRVGGAA